MSGSIDPGDVPFTDEERAYNLEEFGRGWVLVRRYEATIRRDRELIRQVELAVNDPYADGRDVAASVSLLVRDYHLPPVPPLAPANLSPAPPADLTPKEG